MTNPVIGIVSDTHENNRVITKAVKIFKERNPEFVVHCGDIVSPPVLERFSGLKVKVVYGNNDGERSGLRKKCHELGFDEIVDTLEFEYLGKKFFVYHGTNATNIQKAIDKQWYDYILHGHTHEVRNELIGVSRVINPGALFMAPTLTIAFLHTGTGAVEFVEIPE
jgi:putative phosphoesterase